jgi:hypothetical protein
MSLVSGPASCYPALVWRLLKRAQIPLWFGVIAAALYLGYVLLARHTADQRWAGRHRPTQSASEAESQIAATYGGSAVKILQFYAREGAITEDQSTVICYGVVNAKSVRIEPPLPGVYPSINKCTEVSPEHDTKYTLTAEGQDGHTQTAAFTLLVKPDLANRPRITEFRVVKHNVELGRHYFTLSFQFENANKVTIDPPVFSPIEDSAPSGQWLVAPETSTTYTLTVMDKKGRKASKQLTVEVPKR